MTLNNSIKKILVFCLMFINVHEHKVNGQQISPAYIHYTTADGLPSSEIHQVFQDSKGYIWIATDRGLTKFNGYEFKTYTTKDGLLDNTVFKLFEDKSGRIWLYTFSGQVFYFENERIHAFPYNDLVIKQCRGRIILGIYVNQQDELILSVYCTGILKITRDGKFSWDGNIGELPHNRIVINETCTDTMLYYSWFSAPRNSGCDFLHYQKNQVDSVYLNKKITGQFRVMKIAPGHYLLGAGNCLFRKSGGKVELITDRIGEIYSLVMDTQHGIWIGTNNGVYNLKGKDEIVPVNDFLNKATITSILQDREGGFWFSTLERGLYYQPGHGIHNLRFSDERLYKPVCLSAMGDTVLYAGFWSGVLLKIDQFHAKIIYNQNAKSQTLPLYNLTKFDGLDNIYLSSGLPGYLKADKFYALKGEGVQMIKSNVIKRKNGEIYGVGICYLFKIINDSEFTVYGSQHRLNCLAEFNNNKLLIGTNSGVFLFDEINHKEIIFRKDLDQLRVDDIKIFQDYICFGTKGKGLLILKKDSIHIIDASGGLCSDLVNKITIDGNSLWCSTNMGLSHVEFTDINKFQYTITNINTASGLPDNEISDVAVLGDTLYIATNTGISFFNKKTIFNNNVPPKVYITACKINNLDSVIPDKAILPYNLNNMRIGFVGISSKSIKNISYVCRLIRENDTTWVRTMNRQVDFLGLNPGKYFFTVSAINSSGVKSNEMAAFSFAILPAWWQTTWFKFAMLMLLLLILFLVYQNRLARIKNEYRLERTQANLQLTAMRAQMNPHFIFNVMSSIRNYMQDHDLKSAEKYLTSFAKLIRYTLDQSGAQEVTLEEELQALKSYVELESQRLSEGCDFIILCEDEAILEDTMLPSMILQPFVENAIKHGISKVNKRGLISIKIQRSKEFILLSIEDNGAGRDASGKWNAENLREHQSHGTAITFNRIAAYNKAFNRKMQVRFIDLYDEQGNSNGTRVDLIL